MSVTTHKTPVVNLHWLAGELASRGLIPECANASTQARLGLPARPNLFLLHAEWLNGHGSKEYADGHIPSAMLVDTDAFEDGYPSWRLRPLADLNTRCNELGIGAQSTLIIYAKSFTTACRLWWILHFCGAVDVRVLLGGLEAWRSAGLPLTQTATQPSSSRFLSTACHQALISTVSLQQLLSSPRPALQLFDVRSQQEFAGQHSGYEYLDRAGRIPHAKHLPLNEWLPCLEAFDLSGLQANWQRHGVTNDSATPLVFYCGSGWRSAVAYLAAFCLGYRHVSNYSDGWCGWSTEYQQDPLAKGSTPGWRQQHSGRPVVTSESR